jgi:hypothetical protein
MGQGGGRAAGGGRGWRHRFHATGLTGWQRSWTGWFRGGPLAAPGTTPETELAGLREQAAELEHALAEAKSRIQEAERIRETSPSPPREDER